MKISVYSFTSQCEFVFMYVSHRFDKTRKINLCQSVKATKRTPLLNQYGNKLIHPGSSLILNNNNTNNNNNQSKHDNYNEFKIAHIFCILVSDYSTF